MSRVAARVDFRASDRERHQHYHLLGFLPVSQIFICSCSCRYSFEGFGLYTFSRPDSRRGAVICLRLGPYHSIRSPRLTITSCARRERT